MHASNAATTSVDDSDSTEREGQKLCLKTHVVLLGAILTTYLG
jgi:hypothetical protein